MDRIEDLMSTTDACSAYWANCTYSGGVLTIEAEGQVVTVDADKYRELALKSAEEYVNSGSSDTDLVREASVFLDLEANEGAVSEEVREFYGPSVGLTDLFCQHIFDSLSS